MDFLTDPSLKLYLPLYELDGTQFASKDAYGHLCTSNGSTWALDSHGFATNDDIDIVSALSTISSDTTGTLMMWYRPDLALPVALSAIINFADTSAIEMVEMYHRHVTGEIYIQCYVTDVLKWAYKTTLSPFSDTTWACVGLVQNGVAPVVYVNDDAPAMTALDETDKTVWLSGCPNIDNGYIGTRNVSGAGKASYMNGRVGEVWYFNRALTLPEFRTIYSTTKDRY